MTDDRISADDIFLRGSEFVLSICRITSTAFFVLNYSFDYKLWKINKE